MWESNSGNGDPMASCSNRGARAWLWVLSLTITAFATAEVRGQVTVEYIGHAAVVVEGGGQRILIDPYNGSRWMGFDFPRDLDVDAVLVTHPHYDHDASYYLNAEVPVFREPGEYRVGAVRLIGIEGEHAGGSRYRDRGIEPFNVIWTVEVGGRRLTHVGDNRVLTASELDAVAETDVLFVPPFHSPGQARATAEALHASLIVPIHYKLPNMAAEGYGLPTVDQWLDGAAAEQLGVNRMSVSESGSATLRIVVFSPAPEISGWSSELAEAWGLFARANELSDAAPASAGDLLERATGLAPEVMSFPLALAEVQVEGRDVAAAVHTLESALARATEGDIEPTLRARALLAGLYAQTDRTDEATLLYREVLRAGRSYAADAQQEAREFLSGR